MKIAVITGSSYGLGLSITKLLLSNDFKVYGISRSEPPIKNSNFVWIKADLLNDNDLKNVSDKIKEEKIDLLVLASHGRSGLKHILMGSVAQKCVQISPCSVWVVKT